MSAAKKHGKSPRRIDSSWIRSAPLKQVFDALQSSGAETRVVGGAVRDALLKRPIGEIDLATTARPDETMRLAAAAGLSAHPTGIDHGTVTLVAGGASFEVTTLRCDVETDGRRAVVAFTADWAEDAERRDFTINALSADRDGAVYDYVGGLADLDARRVRFIGDPAARIREDYLRILRFFRFSAGIVDGPLDRDGLAACIALRDGISRLSGERIAAEIFKLLVQPRAAEISAVMQAAGALEAALGVPGHPDRLMRLQHIEKALSEPADPVTRLAVLALDAAADAKKLSERLKLSNRDAARLEAAAGDRRAIGDGGIAGARALLYRLGPDAYARAVRAAWARGDAPADDETWRQLAELPKRWTAPKPPFTGADVLALGVEAGPRVGKILAQFEAWWTGADFPSDRGQLEARLAALAQHD
jgi:poly(A) polymerase